jgi:uncharacterized protein (TIGR02145 family)
MNCSKCKAEWTPPVGPTITNCPFCGEALVAATFASKEAALHEMLHSIVQQFGREILGETRLRGLISDLMPNTEKKYLRILKQAVDDGVGTKLLEMDSDTFAVRALKIPSLKETFKNNNGFSNTADYVMECFLYALGWLKKSPEEKPEKAFLHNLDILEHAAEMAFSDGKLTKEEARSLFDLGHKLALPEKEVEDVVKLYIDLCELKPDVPSGKNAVLTKDFIISRAWISKPAKAIAEEYESVKIGDQTWMKQNLDVSHFRNGDPIPEVKTDEEWKKAGEEGKSAWCYYDNKPENGKIYGKLYNWYAVNDSRGLAPEGWHVPSDEDWKILENKIDIKPHEILMNFRALYQFNLSSGGMRGYDIGKKLKAKSGWAEKGNGTNQFLFEALPGGDRSHRESFRLLGESCNWWSSSQDTDVHAWYRTLTFEEESIGRYSYFKSDGQSVRCIKNTSAEFETISIGNLFLMKNNLNVDCFRNGDPILEAKSDQEWKKAFEENIPVWCYYKNIPEVGKTYGKLYNGFAVMDPRGLAPEGWHIPSNEEWFELIENLICTKGLSNKKEIITKLYSSDKDSDLDKNTLDSKISSCRTEDGDFTCFDNYGDWWSNSEPLISFATLFEISILKNNHELIGSFTLGSGLYVRCLEDNEFRKFGDQIWSLKNLNISRFRNSDAIPEAKTDQEWAKANNEREPAWRYYDNDPENGKIYGKLYNWFAVNDPRGLAPEGWHVPSYQEWSLLRLLLFNENVGAKMKSTIGWYEDGNGNNQSRFTGLPGGYCDLNGSFVGKGYNGHWWSSSEDNSERAWGLELDYKSDGLSCSLPNNCYGFSVRCVKGDPLEIKGDTRINPFSGY